MNKRTLGGTGLGVTVLGYGAMELRGPTAKDSSGATDEDAERVLNDLLDGGINFIDTAPDYGLSEERIGKFIAHRRHEFFLATKCGCNIPRPDDPDAPRHVWTSQRLRHNIEMSLQRLKTDYVDIWQLHNPLPEDVEGGGLVEVMQDVRRQGKVRHISISTKQPPLGQFIDQGIFETFQIPYSALNREHEQAISTACEKGAGTIIRGGVAQGEPDDDWASNRRWAKWSKAHLDELLDDGETRTGFILRLTITHPHVHTTIVGTRNLNHLKENIEAAEAGPLDAPIYEEVKRRLDAVEQVTAPQ